MARSTLIGIIARVSKLLPVNILLQLYYTRLVQPYLVYCNLVWASNYLTRLLNLSILYRKAMHTLSNTHQRRYVKSADLFRQTRILAVSRINLTQNNEFMLYKWKHFMVSGKLQRILNRLQLNITAHRHHWPSSSS